MTHLSRKDRHGIFDWVTILARKMLFEKVFSTFDTLQKTTGLNEWDWISFINIKMANKSSKKEEKQLFALEVINRENGVLKSQKFKCKL